jgi:hypothetical protein
MSRWFVSALLVVAMTGTLIYGLVGCSSQSEAQSELDRLNEELLSTMNELDSVKKELTSKRTELMWVQADLDWANFELAQINDPLAKLQLYEDIGINVYDDFGTTDNETASDPTWAELLDFLRGDKTDENAYVPDNYVCAHFAWDVHDNAERAGIRAAVVSIELSDIEVGHALNAFKTTDRGLVFIDCTGTGAPQPGQSYDKIVSLGLGTPYAALYLSTYQDTFEGGVWTRRVDWGTVTWMSICW